jgi:hypothetical protein
MSEEKVERKISGCSTFEEFCSQYLNIDKDDASMLKFAASCIRGADEEEAEDFLLRFIHHVRRTERFK